MRIGIVCLLAFLGAGLAFSAAGAARAQTTPPANLPDAPKPQTQTSTVEEAHPSDSYFYRMGVLCGAGASTSGGGTVPAVNCGAGMTIIPWLIPWPLWVEVGVMGPQANRSAVSGYVSVDQDIPLAKTTRVQPVALVGYSRLFETGHALDYGLALALPRLGKPKDPSSSLRIELRDYCTFANPTQHNVMLRVGWMSEEAD
jgi:hypothetical protein